MATDLTQANDSWTKLLHDFERRLEHGQPEVAELAGMLWARLRHHDGPPIDFLHGEDPDDLLKWFFRSASPKLQEVFRAAIHHVLRTVLPGIAVREPFSCAALAALANLVEVSRPPADRPLAANNPIAAYLRQQLFCEAGPSVQACAWYAARTPLGRTLLAYLLRALASVQQDPSLAPAWLDLLKAEDMPSVAVPAFYGLLRSVGQDARVALPLLVHARYRENDPQSVASCVHALLTDGYLCEGERLFRRAQVRPRFDRGDLAVMFQGIPRTERKSFVQEVFGWVRRWESGLARLPHDWEQQALAPPPRCVFLDAVDSPRYSKWPAFHLVHWPAWARDWADEIDVVWINLEMPAEIDRPWPVEPRRGGGPVHAQLLRPDGSLDDQRIQQYLQPLVNHARNKPLVVLSAAEDTRQLRAAFQPDIFIPSTDGLLVDAELSGLLRSPTLPTREKVAAVWAARNREWLLGNRRISGIRFREAVKSVEPGQRLPVPQLDLDEPFETSEANSNW